MMIFSSIKYRVLLLAIVPTTAVSFIFFGYFVSKQISDIESNLIEKGKSNALHLASASEYGVFSGNLNLLIPLVESALQDEDILSITITNNLGKPLIQQSKKRAEIPTGGIRLNKKIQNQVYSEPIVQRAINIDDFEENRDVEPLIIGWVIIEVSNQIAIERKNESVIKSLLITLVILISSIILAVRISRHITKPISSLTKSVNEIEKGNLDVYIDTQSTGDLLSLEKGIRNMLQSIKSSQRESQQKIDEATRELRESLELLEHQNAELLLTRQKALSASQSKSAFLANISHEIRTPMNGILGFIKLLKSTQPSDEQLEYLHTIEQSANNLLRIINDVLDLSKIEAGKIKIQNTNFDLQECIEDSLALISPSAHEKGLDVASLYYDDLPKILFGAVDRVRQILINLLGNAIKFSQNGTIMVRAMLESRDNEFLIIKITVTDQGPGISEKDQTRLFNSFTQLDQSDTRKYSGAGLGLAISKSLSEAMGGEIGVESRQGEGSSFWFTFKCQAADSQVLNFLEAPLQAGLSILLYDSNELTRLSISHAFRKLGCNVKERNTFADIIHDLIDNPITDIIALNLTAEEANSTQIINFLEEHSNFIIMVILGSADPALMKLEKEHGATICLTRPFKTSELHKALSNIISSPEDHTDTPISDVESSIEQRRLDGLNILIAEDNNINAKLIDTILSRSGATTVVVEDGKKVVEKILHNDFDIILMDIHMPKMNGIEATKIIRGLEGAKSKIPIIGLTAISPTNSRELLNGNEMNEILEKPISVDEILHEIAYWTRTKRHQKDSESHQPEHPHNEIVENEPALQNKPNRLGISSNLSTTLNEMFINELPDVKQKLISDFTLNNTDSLRNEIHRFLGGMSYCDFEKLKVLTLKFQKSLKANSEDMSHNFEMMINEISNLLATSQNE